MTERVVQLERAEARMGGQAVWSDVDIHYVIPTLPPSSAVIAVASAMYLLTFLSTTRRRPRSERRPLALD